MLCSNEMYAVRTVHSGGKWNQMSKVFNAAQCSLINSYYMKWLHILSLTLFFDSLGMILTHFDRYVLGKIGMSHVKYNLK